MKPLIKLRAFGAEYAIPLQVLAILFGLLHCVVTLPMIYFIFHTLDEHNRLLGLGSLSWLGWLLAWSTIAFDVLVWFILRVLDADLNQGR